MSKRIGIFGGTFDPIHMGHLIMASELYAALDLERVLFVPAPRPPHKLAAEISDDQDRLAMVELAIAPDPRFAVNLIEFNRSGPSYTADTLEQLAADIPDATLVFLMGEDSLYDLPTWHDPERILRSALIGVAARPGFDVDLSAITKAVPAAKDRIFLVPTPEIDISSRGVRQRVADGRPITYFVPREVEAYIAQRGLYRNHAFCAPTTAS
jgi:nicotinate-nucleotide adenylyltransferase